MTTYVYRNGEWIDKELAYSLQKETKASSYYKPTIEYISPLSGKEVTDRGQRREEMKVYGVREVDPSECKMRYKNERFMQKHGLSNEKSNGRVTIV